MKRFVLSLAASAAAIALAPAANAGIFLGYSLDGVTINSLADLDPSVSNATGIGSAGGFDFTLSATGFPTLASPALTSNTINAKSENSKTNTLFLYVTQTDNTAFTGDILSTFTSQLLAGGASSVTISSFYDTANGLFGGTQMASSTFTTLDTSAINSAISAAAPFSTTIRYQLTFTGAGTFNDSAQLAAAVPEPATWGLMLLGFGAMGGMLRTRRQAPRVRFA